MKTTDPAPGSKVEKGSTVTLFVSTGPSTEKTAVPNVIYDSEETARQKIEAAGLKVGNIEPRYSNQDAGIVIETDPLPTTMVSEGSTVNLVVSKGPEPPQEKTYSVYIDLSELSYIDWDVTLDVYLNGQKLSKYTREIRPSAVGRSYEVQVTDTTDSGIQTLLVTIEGYPYYEYEIDFSTGNVTPYPRTDFVPPTDPNASVDPEPPTSTPSDPSESNGGESGDQE